MTPNNGEVTQLLHQMRAGDPKAADHLLPLVYDELHKVARRYMRRERADHTLQATALINEAYLKLMHDDVDWSSRAHFIGVAANVMRRVLVDYARAHKAEHRGGAMQKVELRDDLAISRERLEEVAEVDEGLKALAKVSPRQARVMELRYFGGLSIEEIASVLGIAPRSVKRDFQFARLWLFKELRGDSASPADAK